MAIENYHVADGKEILDAFFGEQNKPKPDHEWDDVVLSLKYVGKGGGDDWLVHGKDGAARACECEVLERKGEGK